MVIWATAVPAMSKPRVRARTDLRSRGFVKVSPWGAYALERRLADDAVTI
jgi:hypothetical protein